MNAHYKYLQRIQYIFNDKGLNNTDNKCTLFS